MFTLKVLFLCMTVSVVFCEYDDEKSNERDSSTLDICLMEGNMSLGELQNMLTRAHNSSVLPIPITQDEKCFLDCIMRKTNMIKNGKISVELLTKSAAKFYSRSSSNPKLIYKRVEDIINACLKTVSDQSMTEECSVAAALYTCMFEETKKAGLADKYGSPVARPFGEYI